MELSVEETGPVERKLRISVPTADVDAAFNAVFREVGRTAYIKGFRKGKAPRSVLEKYYGDRARGEVLERLVRDTLFKAIEQKDLDVLGEPRLDAGEQPKQGASYSYEATVEIRPKIELVRVKGLAVTRPPLSEPEEDPVEAHLQQLRENHGQLVEAEAGAAAARGHVAVLDYLGRVDGTPFEGGSADGAQIELGAGRTIPGFEDNLMGMSVGDEREFEVDFPPDYGAPDLAGKRASFTVKLQGLKRRELPELDDEFAKDVSDEFETLDALRADLRRRVEEGRKQDSERQLREAVIAALIAANPFPLPTALVERQLGERVHRGLQQLGGQVSHEQQHEIAERWTEQWRPAVEREARLALLAPEIASAHEIKVSQEDIDAHIGKIAAQQGRPIAETRKQFRERGLLHALAAGLLEQKVVEFLVSEATLSDA